MLRVCGTSVSKWNKICNNKVNIGAISDSLEKCILVHIKGLTFYVVGYGKKHMHQSTISYFKSLFPVGLSDIFRHFQYLLCLYSLYLGLWGKMFLPTLYNLTWKIYLLLALVFNFHYWTKSLKRYHGSCLPNKTMLHFVIYLIYSNLYIQSPLRNQWLTRSDVLSVQFPSLLVNIIGWPGTVYKWIVKETHTVVK